MNCNCPDETYIQSTVDNVVICTKTTTIGDIFCPEGCQTIIREDGTAYCDCSDTKTPTLVPVKKPIYFDNTDYFKDVSWTISYKPTEGAWNSYFTFYPDFSVSHQEYFQVGYNWGVDKGSLWNHTMSNNSFGVFQGRYNPWILEFPIANDNSNKILNSLSLNIEAKRYLNHYDDSVQPNVGVTDLMIYNSKNNSGKLALHAQKTLSADRKYPYIEDDKQHILTTFTNGEQHINYFYNRLLNENSNVPMFQRDENNILKNVDSRIVKFSGKRVLERLTGKNFIVQLSNTLDSRYNITIKNIISEETTTD